MQNKTKSPFLSLIIMSILIFSWNIHFCNGSFNEQKTDDSFQIYLFIYIFDIDQTKKFATVEIHVGISHSLGDAYVPTTIEVAIIGDGFTTVSCKRIDTSHSYSGDSARITWDLGGTGEMFPFDSYKMNFTIWWISPPPEGGFTLSETNSFARFAGSNFESLKDTWITENQWLGVPIDSFTSKGFTVNIERNSTASIIAFVQFILPILACYFLLNGSVIIKKERLGERLRVHLSLFVFAPMFMIGIRPFLPYHIFLTIPEFLLINLIISTATLGIFSIMPPLMKKYSGRHINDLLGLIISLLIFLILYCVFYLVPLFGKMHPISALLLFSLSLSYVYGYGLRIFFDVKTKKES